MDHRELQELLGMAALERLEADERRALDAHLAEGCVECSSELLGFKESLAAMAMVAAEPCLGDRVWERLARRLDEANEGLEEAGELHHGEVASATSDPPAARARDTAPEARPRPWARPGLWRATAGFAAAAALVLAVLAREQSAQLAASSARYRHQIAALNNHMGLMVADLAAAEGQLSLLHSELDNRVHLTRILLAPEGLRVELEASTLLTRVMLAPDARVIKLQPLPRAPGASGLVTISERSSTAILEVSGLPTSAPDQAYELWWIVARRMPIKAALFRAEPDNETIVLASMPPKGVALVASAITLEGATGEKLPSGPLYLEGQMMK